MTRLNRNAAQRSRQQDASRPASGPSTGPAEVRRIIDHQLAMLWANPDNPHAVPPTMLWGPPGVGKSSLVREACREREIDFIDIRLSQRDPVDIRGLPVPREDAVDWLLSSDWPRHPDSRGIILFDELTAADRALQVAVYEILLDRRLGSLYELPPGWYLMGAGNRGEDRAVATGFSSALANRFLHLEVDAVLEDWLPWARAAGVHPAVTGFLRAKPANLFDMSGDVERGWPSPRSWERVSDLLHSWAERPLPASARATMLVGLLGPGTGREFAAWLRQADALPDAEAMLDGRVPIEIPARADIRHAFCAALVHYLWQGKNETRRLDRFFEISTELSSDFATLSFLDATRHPDEAEANRRIDLLVGHPAFPDWTAQHGQPFEAEPEATQTNAEPVPDSDDETIDMDTFFRDQASGGQ